MQLISIALRNIRSYNTAHIDFPTGIVMLSGDIGSGKSTILLAIEFALFGLLRGELSGNALLRNGTQEGSVELTFKLNDTIYAIKRTLKRTKKSVEQEAGYLLINGIKKEATAIELKSHILDLLGYPQELLTKSKNFVYRYTVYTPQEEMKRILLEDKEERVAILRKVFGVDKYERITQNAASYAKSLRERQRAFDALLADTQEKREQTEEAKQEYEETSQQIKQLLPQLNEAKLQLGKSKQQLALLEQQRRQAEIITRDLHVTKSQLLTKQQQSIQIQNDLAELNQQITEVKELPKVDLSSLTKKNAELSQTLLEKEKQIRTAMTKIAEYSALKKQAAETLHKISLLEQCPTCLQEVTPDHKHSILSAEQKKMQEFTEQAVQYSTLSEQTEKEQQKIKAELEYVRQQEKEIAIMNVKIIHAQELARRKMSLEQQSAAIQQDVQAAISKIKQLDQQISPLKDINNAYEALRMDVDNALDKEKQLSMQHSALAQKEQQLSKTIKLLEQELERKESARKQLEKTQHLHQWLTDYFVPLMDVIEKHVMAKIHHEFDALFQQWFSMLIEDLMAARLDETFTPIIQQNGYDVEVEHLSGGERTACALAYRLALNKTINSLISSIKTKDLLILDEPTDGFSAEQLDKMRDVLEQLNLSQIIIVSHEQKIESFADKVINVAKTEHTSQIHF